MAVIGYHIKDLNSAQSAAVAVILKELQSYIENERLEGYGFEVYNLQNDLDTVVTNLRATLDISNYINNITTNRGTTGALFNPVGLEISVPARGVNLRALLQRYPDYLNSNSAPNGEVPILPADPRFFRYRIPENIYYPGNTSLLSRNDICFTVLFTTPRRLDAGRYNRGIYDLIVVFTDTVNPQTGTFDTVTGSKYFEADIGTGFVVTGANNFNTTPQPATVIRIENPVGDIPVVGPVEIRTVGRTGQFGDPDKFIASIIAERASGSCIIFGCTDSTATNYNPLAQRDNGSCIYISGCTDSKATNYNPNARRDDGSCTYPTSIVFGCTDSQARNYNPLATQDDGSCRYTIDPIAGCTDPKAINYNPAATRDNGSCRYAGPIEGCTDPKATNYNAAAVKDNGTCQYVEGCLDPGALNYNPNAIRDNGTCRYSEGCMDSSALNYNPNAVKDNGTCRYGVNVFFKTIVRPIEANTPELKKSRIVVNGREVGVGEVTTALERGLSYRVEFIPPEHPDYVFNVGVPPSIDFTIPALPTPGERLEYISTFTGIKLPSCFLNVTANYVPAITDKSLLGGIILNGVTPVELNKITETFDPATQTVLLSTGDNRVRLRVPPGVYTVAFKDVNVPGMTYTTPSAFVTNIQLGQTVNETRTYLGKPLPPVYWLRPIDDSEVQQLNHSSIIGMFSDDISNLTTFYTSSNSPELDAYYTHVNHKPESDKTSEIQFSLAYGHILGSGSNGPEGQYNDSPSRSIYAQYRNVILGTSTSKFNLAGTQTDHFYVISYQKDRRYSKVDYDAFELNLAHLSGSEFINGDGYMAAHTGSNVTLSGNGKYLRLISDSKLPNSKFIGNAGVEYNIVSGTIEDGVYNSQAPHYYGKIYPSLGAILLDANKLDVSASFGTVTSRELNGENSLKLFTSISGAADFTDSTGDYLGMKARAVKEEMVNYYFLNVKSKEYNFTNNPSFRNLTTGEIEEDSHRRAKPYITSLGLYDDQRNLVAVVKLKTPVKKTFADEVTFNVRLKI